MPRVARVVIADVAHHVTQRGNSRQCILTTDAEHRRYLDLLRQVLAERALAVMGYCLMSNHVHWVVTPGQAEDLAWVFQQVHGRYAAYWNFSHHRSGHVWQGRFYSCPMDGGHLWTALRYVELNPVRAGLVSEAAEWPWSSAAAHCGMTGAEEWLDTSTWRRHWSEGDWRKFLAQGQTEDELATLRGCTVSGRPLGPKEFTRELEGRTGRRLTSAPRGRPRKIPTEAPAAELAVGP